MKTDTFAESLIVSAAVVCLLAAAALAQDPAAEVTYDPNPKVVHQNLTEVFRRRPMLHTKNMEKLIKGWRCPGELLIFNDVDTGAEVWRLTWHAGFDGIHNHINRSPWNADGSIIGFLSNRGMPGVWKRPTGLGDPHPYVMKADGSSFELFRPTERGFTTLYAMWWSWDREDAKRAYWVSHRVLWRTEFTPDGVRVEPVVDLPNPERRKQLFAPVGEGGILMIKDLNSRDYAAEIYVVDTNKEEIIHRYPLAMNLDWPDKHDRKMEFGFHDCTFRRKPDNSYVINYGSQGAVGEYIFYEFPLDGDRKKIKLAYPSAADPNIPYYSHPAWAPGGRLVATFALEEFGPAEKNPGWWVRDHDAKKPVARLIKGWVSGHGAWDGYDPDWVAAAVGSRHVPEWGAGWIAHAYIPDGVAKKLCRHYTKLAGGKANYGSYARPAQSPDATKVLFHSTMLQQTDATMDIYIAVSHRPAPPTKLTVKHQRQDRIVNPLDVYSLAWEAPNIRREISGYNVYVRDAGGPWELVNPEPVNVVRYQFGRNARRDAVREFFVTSIEHSGLESDRTSPVVRVPASSSPRPPAGGEGQGEGGDASVNKTGLTNWDKTPPAAPTDLKVEDTPAGPRLTWTPPKDKDLRYINVYFSTVANPDPKQSNRIASVIGTDTYLDWSAPKGRPGFYAVTSVDRQGNESKPSSLYVALEN